MSQKLAENELQELLSLRNDYSLVLLNLGESAAKIAELEEQLKSLQSDKENNLLNYKNLVEKDKQISKFLQDKYGKGNINIETGEIIPV